MDNNEFENIDDQEMKVTLTFDNDQTVECVVIATFPVNDKQYMALLPIEESEDISADEIFLYRYTPSDDTEELLLENIEDDDEYTAVAAAFDSLLDEEEFEDLDDIEEDEE